MRLMYESIARRSFLKKSIAVSLAAPFVMSVEEHRLLQAGPRRTRA